MQLPLLPQQLKKALVAENLVAPERFDEIVAEAARKNQNLLDVLVSYKIASAGFLGDLVAQALGVERADFSSKPIDKSVVRVLDEDIARQRQAIVFNREENGVYDVAMLDPNDLEAISFLTQRLQAKIKPFLATPEDLNRGFSVYGYELEKDFKKLIGENVRASLISKSQSIEEAAAGLPIVAIVENILSYAVSSRASDIHIEVLEDSMLIRYRIDGILYEITSVPKAAHPAVTARIKILAGLKIDEHFKPQDGRFRYQIVNQTVDVRVSVMPTFYGEKVEMRLLESSQKPLSLEELGFSKSDTQLISENLKRTYGMILSCGPTGSGKTTSLYAMMNILNKAQVNVVTVEDPIEYNMRYINQTQINPQAGITFASGLRALLRQDPNVIMVGEIRDSETANIAVQAALTGHLLVSSLHTNDAPTAIPRLFDLGVPPFLISSVLNLIIAQRLVRRICQNCVYSYEASPDLDVIIKSQLATLGVKENGKPLKVLYKGSGCASCNMTGYRGRFGIFEIIGITDAMRELITASNFDLAAIKTEARRNGMKTMFEDGLLKVELALTTMDELLRVIQE